MSPPQTTGDIKDILNQLMNLTSGNEEKIKKITEFIKNWSK